MLNIKKLLSHPDFYYYARHAATGGLPFREWVSLYHLNKNEERIADIGCGPADMLRYVKPSAKPAYYLGIDLSEKYLDEARNKAKQLNIPADFLTLDLDKLPADASVQTDLSQLLKEKNISTVLLLGVLHHIDDEAAVTTLDLVYHIPNVRQIITQDILMIPGNGVNNFFAKRDRGQFVRTEREYDYLLEDTKWTDQKKFWTNPGISGIKYIHYKLSRN